MNTRALRTLAVTVALAGTIAISGCSAPSNNSGASDTTTGSSQAPAAEPKTVDLTGEWKQKNPTTPDNYQTATVTSDTIEVYFVANNGDTKSLFWAGSATVPEGKDSFTFDSANDTAKTSKALLASPDPTKTFTYKDSELSYPVTVAGTTTTVRLEKQ
ncbi:hypothetical protein MPMin1_gp76 [Microbacterium phage Min1]|uniref:Lipoprotein n=1 Tax=Microbacterium phage Min1 TaxID=446529 RepID=A6N234_9CAUD|nr:hypothetical protein MPMin1_gp76 [Microbacterium phage Min1]ABR10506.1 hypothetical protein [Microbacterium phage Min1]MBG9887459.1 hypothetical protein [Bacillus toyonensis]